jgi:prepilin-type N-terminal cleavage/methylation domain-containing protein
MKSEFKAKLLQHVLSKKDSEKGFTLIELLVVIIIIGILAAIALPSFLNQSNKAKQSEAKTYVGSLNKGQQAYFTEKSKFGPNVDMLGVGIKTQTDNYTYASVRSGTVDTTNETATSTGDSRVAALRSYAGLVSLSLVPASSDVTSLAILCENNLPGIGTAATPSNGSTCSAGTQPVGN